MKNRWILVWYCCICSLLGCKDTTFDNLSSTNVQQIGINKNEEYNQYNSNPSRAIWQKPGIVIEKLGVISDKIIADIGAGTGYFSFKLAPKALKVIAIDIEPKIISYLDSVKSSIPNLTDKLENRLGKANDPMLKNEEADIIIIINTIAYIPNLDAYLLTLKKGLKKNGTLMIIDYKMKKLPIQAPPKSERIYLDKLEEMLEASGYKIIDSDDTSLDYQYILSATKNN